MSTKFIILNVNSSAVFVNSLIMLHLLVIGFLKLRVYLSKKQQTSMQKYFTFLSKLITKLLKCYFIIMLGLLFFRLFATKIMLSIENCVFNFVNNFCAVACKWRQHRSLIKLCDFNITALFAWVETIVECCNVCRCTFSKKFKVGFFVTDIQVTVWLKHVNLKTDKVEKCTLNMIHLDVSK